MIFTLLEGGGRTGPPPNSDRRPSRKHVFVLCLMGGWVGMGEWVRVDTHRKIVCGGMVVFDVPVIHSKMKNLHSARTCRTGAGPGCKNTAGGCPVVATLKVAPATRFSDSGADSLNAPGTKKSWPWGQRSENLCNPPWTNFAAGEVGLGQDSMFGPGEGGQNGGFGA